MTTSYALITPSYRRDFERCTLLVESVHRWVAPHVQHYLVIARRDVALFKPLLGARVELIVVEDIIPRWLFLAPGVRRFWLSARTLPVRNWILQQLVKLSVPEAVQQDVLLYADSDMFFVEPYDPRSYEREGKVPLFVETGQRGLIPKNDEWHGVSARLLGVPRLNSYDTNYVNQLICWRRTTVQQALRRVEEVRKREWAQTIAALRAFSEYTFYGVYVDAVAGAESCGHWHDGEIRTLNYWRPQPLNLAGLEAFKAARRPHHHSVMVSAKSNTSTADIRSVFLDSICPGEPRGRAFRSFHEIR